MGPRTPQVRVALARASHRQTIATSRMSCSLGSSRRVCVLPSRNCYPQALDADELPEASRETNQAKGGVRTREGGVGERCKERPATHAEHFGHLEWVAAMTLTGAAHAKRASLRPCVRARGRRPLARPRRRPLASPSSSARVIASAK